MTANILPGQPTTPTAVTVVSSSEQPSDVQHVIDILEVLDEAVQRLTDNVTLKVIQDVPGDLHVTVDAHPPVSLAANQTVTISGPVSVIGAFFQPTQPVVDPLLYDVLDRILSELRFHSLYLASLLTSAGVRDDPSESDLMEMTR